MHIRIVGAGLLGASIGLSLGSSGHEISLHDASPLAMSLACGLGAGRAARSGDRPDVVVIAAPPDVTAELAVQALREYPDALVMDVASVKTRVLRELEMAMTVAEHTAAAARFVGTHPMAGKERSGAVHADGDLFRGRPWVLVPTADTAPETIQVVTGLVVAMGALPITMDAGDHDDAVAAISHLPQVMASLVAGQLVNLDQGALALAGQGLRDTTRIAHSDPLLWSRILAANAGPVRAHLVQISASLDELIAALRECEDHPYPPAGVAGIVEAINRGGQGVARIPGKHGGAQRVYREIEVYVPDRPGQLGRLFAEIGEANVNIEDVRLEHAAAATMGVATLSIEPGAAGHLITYLEERGWSVVGQ